MRCTRHGGIPSGRSPWLPSGPASGLSVLCHPVMGLFVSSRSDRTQLPYGTGWHGINTNVLVPFFLLIYVGDLPASVHSQFNDRSADDTRRNTSEYRDIQNRPESRSVAVGQRTSLRQGPGPGRSKTEVVGASRWLVVGWSLVGRWLVVGWSLVGRWRDRPNDRETDDSRMSLHATFAELSL